VQDPVAFPRSAEVKLLVWSHGRKDEFLTDLSDGNSVFHI